MEEIVHQVRSLVLGQASLHPDLVHAADLKYNIEQNDGMIKMFCKQYSESNDGKYDKESIADRIMETMKWRKTFALPDMKAEDFPLELWTKNRFLIFEDKETLITLFILYNDQKICPRFTELQIQLAMFFQDRYSLPAVQAGKKIYHITSVSDYCISSINMPMHIETVKLMDRHFPCLADNGGFVGINWLIAPIANFFMKHLMPISMRKTYRVCTEDELKQMLPLNLIPVHLGGTAKFKDVAGDLSLKSVKDCHKEFGLTEGEAKKILKVYDSIRRK